MQLTSPKQELSWIKLNDQLKVLRESKRNFLFFAKYWNENWIPHDHKRSRDQRKLSLIDVRLDLVHINMDKDLNLDYGYDYGSGLQIRITDPDYRFGIQIRITNPDYEYGLQFRLDLRLTWTKVACFYICYFFTS